MFTAGHAFSTSPHSSLSALSTSSLLTKRNDRVDAGVRGGHTLHFRRHTHCMDTGCIRMKMMTAVFGGAPPPAWGNGTDTSKSSSRHALAQYVLSTFVPWTSRGIRFTLNVDGLMDLCDSWDRRDAPLVDKQRCRYVRNVGRRGYR